MGGSPPNQAPPPSVSVLGDRGHLRATFRLAWPIALAQMATLAMGIVDSACVGRVSAEALAAVSIGIALAFGVLTLGLGFCLAMQPLVAQARGAGHAEEGWGWYLVTRRVVCAAYLPILALVLLLAHNLEVFGVSASLAELSWDYVLAISPGMGFMLLFWAARGYLQAVEDTRPLIKAALVANVVNLLLDYLLVFGDEGLGWIGLPEMGVPAMGAVGAGLTTTVSSIYLAWSLHQAAKRHAPDEAVISLPSMRMIWRLGIPIGIHKGAEGGLFSATSLLAGVLGAIVTAGHQIALILASLAFMTAVGVSAATSVRVGWYIGAEDLPGAKRAGWTGASLGLLTMSLSAIIFLCLPEPLARAFTNDDAVIEQTVHLLGIAAAFALFDGLQAVMTGALRGVGDVRTPMWINLVSHWPLGIGSACVLAFEYEYGVIGLWYGITLGLMAASLTLSARFAWLTSRPIRRLVDR